MARKSKDEPVAPRPKMKAKTVNEALGIKPFYADSERIDFSDLIGKSILIVDAVIIADFDSEFGKHDLCLIAFKDIETESDEVLTTACSGIVIVKKIRSLLEKRLLPIIGTVNRDNRYYDLL